jgi:PhoD related phosphatase
MRLVGPILQFRGQTEDRWRLAALVVGEGLDAPAPLELPGSAPIAPERLAVRRGHAFWRYDFTLPLRGEEVAARYAMGQDSWSVDLPAASGGRRVAYAACNGNDDEGNGGPVPPWRNALWRRLAAEHARTPFHLLLQGGDQLYADTLWKEVPELGAWRRLPWREGNTRPFTPTMAERAHAYFLESYLRLWKQPETAALLASIPSVMMWDDHDIFDGWGSWPEERQGCPVFQGVFAVARQYFALFQLAALPNRLPEGFGDPGGGHYGCAFRAGPVGIVAPDLRSERTRGRIMGEAGWRAFEAALNDLAGCRHVLVMSSVPLVNADMTWLERLYVAAPGHSDLEDDLRDQWQSFGHRDEWRRILAYLVAFSARTGARVTALSGEIHLGALGVVEGKGGVRVHQLTSSGIVHAPPPMIALAAYELLGRHTTVLEPGLRARLLAIPGHGRRYLRRRNWLSLDAAGDGRFRAAWHTEQGEAGSFAAVAAGNGSVADRSAEALTA